MKVSMLLHACVTACKQEVDRTGVSTLPGLIEFTRTFLSASSSAMHFVNPSMAHFEVEYAPMFAKPCTPALEEMFTMVPLQQVSMHWVKLQQQCQYWITYRFVLFHC